MGFSFIDEATFRDKVLGCWMGKNCGGTLGAPLEKVYGEEELFDVWWYPEIREGGIPNDDLEMQLVWLKALEEVGPGLKASDLTQYWLDHIGYNWDEYGLSKTNMRLGLLPPAASSYNNWFVDCMGCPIRSEIWACIAPGTPRIAVRYAYEDAICDHAGGESVFGELFNTAIESAAFVISDIRELLAIGRSYVPDGSATAAAVDAAINAFDQGLDWKTSRNRVIAAAPNYNAQYSPINMGFQVVGLLYGTDFGDTICKAVNCGYDTDCTGATVGSILGILKGASGLPEKWTEPLGTAISTNESWGGLKNVSKTVNPVPTNLDELTERTIAQAHRIRKSTEPDVAGSESLYADAEVRRLWKTPACSVSFGGRAVKTVVNHGDYPTIAPAQKKFIKVSLTSLRASELSGTARVTGPEGWIITPQVQKINLAPQATIETEWLIIPPVAKAIGNSNRLSLIMELEGRSSEQDVPIVLVGARAVLISELYPLSEGDPLETAYPAETLAASIDEEDSRGGSWQVHYFAENKLDIAILRESPGVVYARIFLLSESERDVCIGVPATCPTKVFFNNVPMLTCANPRRLRPNYGGDGDSYFNTTLAQGWNEILIKLVRRPDDPDFDAHLTIADPKAHHEGLLEAIWTHFPWDE